MFEGDKYEEVMRAFDEVDGKVYIGCDSIKFKKHGKWYARYAVVIVIHVNNKNGGMIFHDTVVEPDWDATGKKPRMRLMREVYLAVECFEKFLEILIDREVEIHLDVNPNHLYRSASVVNEACGYVLGMTGVEPKIKPEAFAASYAADATCRGRC